MRIVHLIYDDLQNPWLAGGGAVRADEIYRRLADRHEVTLVTGSFPGDSEAATRNGIRLVRVGRGSSYVRSRLQYCRGAVAALKGLAWDLWVHEFSAFAPLWPPAALRRRGILFFYHFVGHHALRKHPLVGAISWLAETLTLRAYPRVLTISPSVQEEVRRRLRGRRVEVDCVFTGVDPRYFTLVPVEEPYILSLGRLDLHTKGLDVLVAAFARIAQAHPGIALKIAGRGTPGSRDAVLRLAAREGVESRVELIGGVDEQQKGELLRRCLFVCMPSRYEGWGIVAVEAAAAGKPVLGTRIAGLRDAVRDGETGVLVPSGDVPALAEGMSALLADPGRRLGMGGCGREWARRFDWERIARDQEQALLQAAGHASR